MNKKVVAQGCVALVAAGCGSYESIDGPKVESDLSLVGSSEFRVGSVSKLVYTSSGTLTGHGGGRTVEWSLGPRPGIDRRLGTVPVTDCEFYSVPESFWYVFDPGGTVDSPPEGTRHLVRVLLQSVSPSALWVSFYGELSRAVGGAIDRTRVLRAVDCESGAVIDLALAPEQSVQALAVRDDGVLVSVERLGDSARVVWRGPDPGRDPRIYELGSISGPYVLGCSGRSVRLLSGSGLLYSFERDGVLSDLDRLPAGRDYDFSGVAVGTSTSWLVESATIVASDGDQGLSSVVEIGAADGASIVGISAPVDNRGGRTALLTDEGSLSFLEWVAGESARPLGRSMDVGRDSLVSLSNSGMCLISSFGPGRGAIAGLAGDGSVVWSLTLPEARVSAVAFSPDREEVAVAQPSVPRVRRFDIATGAEIEGPASAFLGIVDLLAASPQRDWVTLGTKGGALEVWGRAGRVRSVNTSSVSGVLASNDSIIYVTKEPDGDRHKLVAEFALTGRLIRQREIVGELLEWGWAGASREQFWMALSAGAHTNLSVWRADGFVAKRSYDLPAESVLDAIVLEDALLAIVSGWPGVVPNNGVQLVRCTPRGGASLVEAFGHGVGPDRLLLSPSGAVFLCAVGRSEHADSSPLRWATFADAVDGDLIGVSVDRLHALFATGSSMTLVELGIDGVLRPVRSESVSARLSAVDFGAIDDVWIGREDGTAVRAFRPSMGVRGSDALRSGLR